MLGSPITCEIVTTDEWSCISLMGTVDRFMAVRSLPHTNRTPWPITGVWLRMTKWKPSTKKSTERKKRKRKCSTAELIAAKCASTKIPTFAIHHILDKAPWSQTFCRQTLLGLVIQIYRMNVCYSKCMSKRITIHKCSIVLHIILLLISGGHFVVFGISNKVALVATSLGLL